MVLAPEREPILASDEEVEQIGRVQRMLGESAAAPRAARLVSPDGEETELPAALYEVLLRAAHALASGSGISVLPLDALLTTQQAANLLNISRPSLVTLLDDEQLAYHRLRSHRRIRLRDLLDYRRRRDEASDAAVRRIVGRAQELGVYDDYRPVVTR